MDPGPQTLVRDLDLGPSQDPQIVSIPQKNFGEEAVVVWDAALVLSYFLVKNFQKFLGEKISVLELGAGTGAVGLVAAALGAKKVILTDLPRIVPLLEEGIALNKHKINTKIEARSLTWGDLSDSESLKNEQIDLILISDCIYYEASVKPLIQTLINLSHPGVKILISYEKRDYLESKVKIEKEFFREIGANFQILPFKTEDCHEEFASDDIKVIQLVPKDHAN